jgi:hypothetical protein
MYVLVSRIKAVVLSLLATAVVVAVGANTAAAAEGGAGPFWHHRPVGETKNIEGTKLASGTTESFKGEGGEQKLKGKIGETEVEINSPKALVKGAISNGEHQGQIKLEIVYEQPRLIKPALKECNVIVGEKNIVTVKGHLAWKWNGEQSQLSTANSQKELGQTWDFIFSPIEPQEQKPFPEIDKLDTTAAGTFANIQLTGSGCGIIAGTVAVSGTEVGIPNRPIEEFNKTLAVRTAESSSEGSFLQHVWVGSRFQGELIGLRFAGNAANLIGQTEVTAAQQEIAVFEK